jgi:hypothetical protein
MSVLRRRLSFAHPARQRIASRIDNIEPILGPVDDIKIGMDRLAVTAAENGDVERLCSANDSSKRWQCYDQYRATVVTREIPSSSCSLVELVHDPLGAGYELTPPFKSI